MVEWYHSVYDRARKIEGASQRVQEDTIKFSRIMESLGTSFIEALMVLFQFYFIYVTFNANALLSQDQATIKDKLSIRIEGINLYLNDENFRGNWNTKLMIMQRKPSMQYP